MDVCQFKGFSFFSTFRRGCSLSFQTLFATGTCSCHMLHIIIEVRINGSTHDTNVMRIVVSLPSFRSHCLVIIFAQHFAKLATFATMNLVFATELLCFVLHPSRMFLQLLGSFGLKPIRMQFTSILASLASFRPVCFAEVIVHHCSC